MAKMTVDSSDLAFVCELARKMTGTLDVAERVETFSRIDALELDKENDRFSFTFIANAIINDVDIEAAQAKLLRTIGVAVDAHGQMFPENRGNGVLIYPMTMMPVAIDPE